MHDYSLGRRFNGLHDYLFKLYHRAEQIGAFALTEQQFNRAIQGKFETVECRFNEDSLDENTREAKFSLRESATGWTMLLHLTRYSYSILLSEDQLTTLQHHYATEPVLIEIGEAPPR